jgi:hypothetical protein
MGVFMLARLGMTADQFEEKFKAISFKEYRDSSF